MLMNSYLDWNTEAFLRLKKCVKIFQIQYEYEYEYSHCQHAS